LSLQQEVLLRTNRVLLSYDMDHIEHDAFNNSSILSRTHKGPIS
jgi:hypothetical protein